MVKYVTRSHKLVLPIKFVIEDFQQFLAINEPSSASNYEKLPDVMPITTDSLPAVSHPEWGEIIDAKGSFGWQSEMFNQGRPRAWPWKYGDPCFVFSGTFKNLNESDVKIQYSAKFQAYSFQNN